jgi:hypothetical protein
MVILDYESAVAGMAAISCNFLPALKQPTVATI